MVPLSSEPGVDGGARLSRGGAKVPIRYLYVYGMTAWNWASIAKRIAVGPAGRYVRAPNDAGRRNRARTSGGSRVVYGSVARMKDFERWSAESVCAGGRCASYSKLP